MLMYVSVVGSLAYKKTRGALSAAIHHVTFAGCRDTCRGELARMPTRRAFRVFPVVLRQPAALDWVSWRHLTSLAGDFSYPLAKISDRTTSHNPVPLSSPGLGLRSRRHVPVRGTSCVSASSLLPAFTAQRSGIKQTSARPLTLTTHAPPLLTTRLPVVTPTAACQSARAVRSHVLRPRLPSQKPRPPPLRRRPLRLVAHALSRSPQTQRHPWPDRRRKRLRLRLRRRR